MLSAVLATIAAHDLLSSGDRVIVAVSGGPDSMALLHALWELRARLGLTLEVAAVDHGLRADACREIDLVRERAGALGLPFAAVAVDVAAERRGRRGVSLQDAAREVRLRALAALAGAHGATRVALGHQADDQAETILFRIVRGTGIAGLAGIPYRRDVFVRPLLDVTRAQILRYLARRSIPFADDPSNADARFARARIRHQILPALAQENPRVAEALRALAASARARPRRRRQPGRRRGRRVVAVAARGGDGRAARIARGHCQRRRRGRPASRGFVRARACGKPHRRASVAPGGGGPDGADRRHRPTGRVPLARGRLHRGARRRARGRRHEQRRRRVRRRSNRVAADAARAPPGRQDAAAWRQGQPQALRPDDRRQDRAAGSRRASGRDQRRRHRAVRARASPSRSRPSQRDHPSSDPTFFRTRVRLT